MGIFPDEALWKYSKMYKQYHNVKHNMKTFLQS